jgi:zinc/manganese transport system permease protein
MALTAVGIALLSGYIGLVVSYRLGLPSGPAIVLTASLIYGVSILVGSRDGLLRRGLAVIQRANEMGGL